MAQTVTPRFAVSAALLSALLAVTIIVGAVLRLWFAVRLSPHVDEAASILAAHAVAEHFLPILPSGTVYFQGYTLSLILTPFVWLGHGGLDDLLLMRLVSVAAGTGAIYLTYRLARTATGRYSVAMLAALFLAIDPMSVQWSGHVRMYALLQLIVVALGWTFAVAVRDGMSARRAAPIVALAWAAVLTHVGAAIVVAALLSSIMVVYRMDAWRCRSARATIVLSGMAPVALLLANRLLAPESAVESGDAASTGLWFVGNSQVQLFGLLDHRSMGDLLSLAQLPHVSFWLVPAVIVVLGSVVAGVVMFRGLAGGNGRGPVLMDPRAGQFIILTCWLTAFAFLLFSKAVAGRYVMHIQPFGYILIAALVVWLVDMFAVQWSLPGLVPGVLTGSVIVALLLMLLGVRVAWRFEHPVMNADYHAAARYVEAHHDPGQPVIVALPPPLYLGMEEEDHGDIVFLAGPAGGDRARDYSRVTTTGERIDYWIGAHTIVSANDLRQALVQHPDALVVVDWYRLTADGIYRGEIENVIRQMTDTVYQGPGGVLVLVPKPPQFGPHPQDD